MIFPCFSETVGVIYRNTKQYLRKMQYQLSEDIGQAVGDTFAPEYGYKIPEN